MRERTERAMVYHAKCMMRNERQRRFRERHMQLVFNCFKGAVLLTLGVSAFINTLEVLGR